MIQSIDVYNALHPTLRRAVIAGLYPEYPEIRQLCIDHAADDAFIDTIAPFVSVDKKFTDA